MVWIVGWSVFMGFQGYKYGGEQIGMALVSFGFWFLVLMAARIVITNIRGRQVPPPSEAPKEIPTPGIRHS